MSALGQELATYDTLLREQGMVLATTPARVCTQTGAAFLQNVPLSRTTGAPDEQFYKWQFVAALISSGLVPADCIGCELPVPRGSRGSTSLFVDVVIFADPTWAELYDEAVAGNSNVTMDDVYRLVVASGEIKDDPHDDVEAAFRRQLLPALNNMTVGYGVGFYYNSGHLVVISRSTDSSGVTVTRLDATKQHTSGNAVQRLNVAVPDGYSLFPSHSLILSRGSWAAGSRSGRAVADLDIVSSRSQKPVEAALQGINRTLDATSLQAETGYRMVIEALAMKIFDEKRSQTSGSALDFYLDAGEEPIPGQRVSGQAGAFAQRMRSLHSAAQQEYASILMSSVVNWSNSAHVRVIAEVVKGFQDVSFSLSTHSDLYQLVFYNFAGPLSKVAQAQFMTPIGVIEFMVNVVNTQQGEKIIDPTMGIADFLAVAYSRALHTGTPLDDGDLYGVDNDASMVMLATLNMLLNGDGNAHLFHVGDTGSLDNKLAVDAAANRVEVFRLDPVGDASGDWEQAPGSGFALQHFDVVLTNPPFGDQRALRMNEPGSGARNREIAGLYEVYSQVGGNQIDKGLLFLENAVRILDTNARYGIILSTAIASVGDYESARVWLMENTRVVALFDMPENMFAETGVPTTIIVGYRPSASRLAELKASDYQVFTKEIDRIGFTKVTRSRVTYLTPKYLVDPHTGLVQHDTATGLALLDEEFSSVLTEFRNWAMTQEPELRGGFV